MSRADGSGVVTTRSAEARGDGRVLSLAGLGPHGERWRSASVSGELDRLARQLELVMSAMQEVGVPVLITTAVTEIRESMEALADRAASGRRVPPPGG